MGNMLENNDWRLEVDLVGGRIVSLVKNGQGILGTFERIDGKTGNTHVCVPNFASEGVEKFGFVFHGPFRNSLWEKLNQTDEGLEIRCQIDGLEVRQKFELGEKFSHKIAVVNNSSSKQRVNVAVHNYWETKNGWRGTKLNGIDVSQGFVTNPEIELKQKNRIEFSGQKPIIWQVNNFKVVKLWTAFKEENGEKVYDQEYVCLEPVMEKEGFVETDKSWLESERKIELSQEISLGV
ncbi:MAG TPA: hypothetical protein PKZ92_02240 [Candidatus Woesebacteria bacterium]|jgi:hypothetical protein|nr:hypothetical protein [Candidatus Shapirobacteria bacterium]HOR02055.1 hypothetical protein [Candidatus Woesebacteria bacterium]